MTVTLPLTAEQEAKLNALARRRGVSAEVLIEGIVKDAVDLGFALPTERSASAPVDFMQLRRDIIAAGIPMLSADELRAEVRERTGRVDDEP